MYPLAFNGEVYSLIIKAVHLSFDTRSAENNDKNTSPNSAIPPVRLFISKSVIFASLGMLELIIDNRVSNTTGKPIPKIDVTASRSSSFAFLDANAKVFIFICPPLQFLQKRPQSLPP